LAPRVVLHGTHDQRRSRGRARDRSVLVEFFMMCLAGSVWMIGVITHFVTRAG
jgi:hypothetical protein